MIRSDQTSDFFSLKKKYFVSKNQPIVNDSLLRSLKIINCKYKKSKMKYTCTLITLLLLLTVFDEIEKVKRR